jgi:hypothetical protein
MPVTEVRLRFTKITDHVVENLKHYAWLSYLLFWHIYCHSEHIQP